MLESALQLAELGYRVFPCAVGAKNPATANGLKDATTDAAQIEAWWTATPTANLAISTDGLFVVDIDVVDGKPNRWLADDPERLLEMAVAPVSLTPRGGRHFIFRAPEGSTLRNTVGKLAPGVDTRANGGYVLVAPSIVAGKPYRWAESDLDCEPSKLPEPPVWLLELLTSDRAASPSIRRDAPSPANPIADGQRNATLTSYAGAMRRIGMGRDEIAAALRAANARRCNPPLAAVEVDRIAASVSRYEPDGVAVAMIEGPAEPIESVDAGPLDPGPMPTELLNVPGFIGDVSQFTLETAPYPEPVLAFGAALALQSLLAARKVCDAGDNRTSLYVLGLANSGAGKDHPRKVNQRILFEAGLSHCIGDAVASGEGLEDLLFIQPAFLLQIDEMNSMLNAIKLGRDGRYENIVAALLKLYTHTNSIYPMRAKAGRALAHINQPGLSILGSAIPNRLYESLSPTMLDSGFLARLLILEAGSRGAGQEASKRDLPDSITAAAKYWAQLSTPGNLATVNPSPRTIPMTDGAAKAAAAYRLASESEYTKAEAASDLAGMAIWARANEKARRLALNYACSANYENPEITEAAVRWSGALVSHQTARMLFMAAAHVTESEFDAKVKKAVDVLRRWKAKRGDDWMPSWQLRRKLPGWTPRELDDVKRTLMEQGAIDTECIESGGRPGVAYRLR